MYLYSPEAQRSPHLCSSGVTLGEQTRFLPCLKPNELILSPDGATEVLQFFWPGKDLSPLGQVTDADRAFAQALLVEAIDSSLTMSWVEKLFEDFYLKLPRSGRGLLLKVAKWALYMARFRRFKGKVLRGEDIKIYENVRVTLARNFRSMLDGRLQTGEYPPYCGD